MTHYKQSQWADYARGVTLEAEGRAMRRHLDDGCRRCARTLTVQRTLMALADSDRRCEAPDYAVRQIKGFFALNRPEERSRMATTPLDLSWDNGLEPARVGVRGGEGNERQVLFEGEEYGLDLRISPFDGKDCVLTGILARPDGEPTGRVSTFLIIDDRVVDQVVSDKDGQFELAADLVGGAELWLEVSADRRLSVTVDPIN